MGCQPACAPQEFDRDPSGDERDAEDEVGRAAEELADALDRPLCAGDSRLIAVVELRQQFEILLGRARAAPQAPGRSSGSPSASCVTRGRGTCRAVKLSERHSCPTPRRSDGSIPDRVSVGERLVERPRDQPRNRRRDRGGHHERQHHGMLRGHLHHDDERCERRLSHAGQVSAHAENGEGHRGASRPDGPRGTGRIPRPPTARGQQTRRDAAQIGEQGGERPGRCIKPRQVRMILDDGARLVVSGTVGQGAGRAPSAATKRPHNAANRAGRWLRKRSTAVGSLRTLANVARLNTPPPEPA